VNPQTKSGPVARQTPGERQPLLWAALAFTAGIATGAHAWRPPLWWVVAWIVFALSGAYLLRRRGRSAFVVGLGAFFFLGALMVQVRNPDNAGNSGWPRFADGMEVLVTAHAPKKELYRRTVQAASGRGLRSRPNRSQRATRTLWSTPACASMSISSN